MTDSLATSSIPSRDQADLWAAWSEAADNGTLEPIDLCVCGIGGACAGHVSAYYAPAAARVFWPRPVAWTEPSTIDLFARLADAASSWWLTNRHREITPAIEAYYLEPATRLLVEAAADYVTGRR